MTTEYAVGDRVQAIDELGRFENGRVISIQQDKFVVKFDGYSSDYNVTTCVSAIRRRLLPYEEYLRSKLFHIQCI